MLDLGQLRSFAEVAERRTVAAAADARGYTAPAVSQHIAKLEAELQTKLFDRVGRHLQLTDAGRALLPVALQMLDLETIGRESVRTDGVVPSMVVAGLASALTALVVPRLSALAELAHLELVEMEDDEAVRDLRLTKADIVLTQEYDGQPVERDQRFTYLELMTDRLRLVLPPASPDTTSLADLGDVPWLFNGRGTRCEQATRTILAKAGLQPEVAGSVADNDALLALVAAGQGVTIAPQSVVESSARPVTLGRQDLGLSRTIYAVTRANPGAAISRVLDCLRRPENGETHERRRGGSD